MRWGPWWVWTILAGLIIGFALYFSSVPAKADPYQCTGWNGTFFQYNNCGGQVCQGFSFGPFYTSQCSDPIPYAPPPLGTP